MGIMGIRTTIAVSLFFAAASAQAVTNSWKSGTFFWDTSSAWSAGFPSITNEVNLVTNLTTKTVTIDAATVSDDPTTLTISNLVVGGPINVTNTLFLSNMQTNTPLRMINSFAITNNGIVQITNSFLEVDGLSGGISQIDGTLKIFPRAKVVLNNTTINAGAILQFALGSNTSPVIVSNLTLGGTVNVTDGGGFSNTTYTLFTYTGALTYNGLTVGSVPTNFNASVNTSTAGQINLVISNTTPAVAHFTASPISNTAPLAVTFTDTSLGGPPLSLTWNLGDGTTNTAGGASFPHTYTNAGTYTVTLTASNAFGVSTLVSNNLITAIAPVLTPFQTWQLQYFNCTNCSQAQPDADPLGKGISNTNQFLLGLNPTNSASVFRITSIVRNTTDVVITWATAGVRTNVVQAVNPGPNGYVTNGLQAISGSIIINITGDTTTNYTDAGGATNTPPRFYRVRLVP